ncbi:MAG: SH3 domain-containing protein [Anaerolineaceae bacterium]|nr:SH3 domain-containing protein [Anaerolineaceae bacterium]
MNRLALTLLYTTWLLLTGLVNAQDDVLFRVVTDTVLNLRACGSTDCARVGQVPAGAELPVHAIEGDWYQVLVDGELVWAAGWLTTRLPETDPTSTPAKLLTMGEIWEDAFTGCNLLVGKVADEAGDLALLLAGDGRQEVRVDVYPPGATAPLPLEDSSDSEADVMGNPVIVRIWPESVRWPAGRYRFELGLGELDAEFEWEMPGPGEYSLLVDCERPAPATGDFPPQLVLTGEIYRDRGGTGCNLFFNEGEGPTGIEVVFVGDRRREVRADLFLPDDNTALQPEPERKYGQFDDGQAYVAQQYPRKADWRTGLYRIELELGESSSAFVWHMDSLGRYFLFVDCEGPASTPATGEASLQLLVSEEIYRDRETGCSLYVSALQGQAGLDILIIGERRREVRVDLFLPREQRALRPEREREEDQPAEGEAYVARLYSSDADWRPGLYRIELDLGEGSSAFAWEMECLGKYALLIDCDAPSAEAGSAQGPVLLELDESHYDPQTGCMVILFPESADEDLNLVIQGERHEDVVARVYRPDAERPLAADGRLARTFSESGRPYMLQFYDVEQGWPAGLYRLELELDGQVGEFAWHMEAPRDQSLIILCDEEPPGREAAGVPVGPTPTPPGAPVAEEPDQGGPLFNVVTNNVLNLRACASADCERVGQVPGGTTLPVYASEGDWYQALVNGELVWVAGWLTTRAPDMFLEDTSMILDERTGCTVLLGARQLFDVLHILVGGERHEDVSFEFYAPGESEALRHSERSVIELEDSGTMIEHVYQGVLLSAGQPYRLLIELDDNSNLVEWIPAQGGGTAIFIICNDMEELRAEAGPGPISSAATQIALVPEEGGDEGPTPAPPVMLAAGDTLRDVQSGCVVRLAPDSPGQDFDVVLSGERRAELEVRVFQPGAEGPLPVSGRSERVLIEGEAPVIRQYYSGDQDWPWGLYRLEVELDGRVSAYLWRMEVPTDQFFLILCNESRTTSPTADSATPVPTAPRLLETDVAWRDDHTGCEILVSDRTLDGDLNILITSSRPEDVDVRIYRPDEESLLPFSGRFRDETEETGLPFDWQFYETDDTWQDGTWTMEVRRDGNISRFAWQLENSGDQVINVSCDTQNLLLTLTPQADGRQDGGASSSRPEATPAPPVMLAVGDTLRDDQSGCLVRLAPDSPGQDFDVVLSGERRAELEVRVFQPGADEALPVTDRLLKALPDDELIIQQYYSGDQDWPWGLYRLELELDGRVSAFLWRMEVLTDQFFLIVCDESRATSPTADSSTPVPAAPRLLETDVAWRDDRTGCELLVSDETLDGDLNIWITSPRPEDVDVRVYRPGESSVLPFDGRFRDDVEARGLPVDWQYYESDESWQGGTWELEVTLDGVTSRFAWQLENQGDQIITILCDTGGRDLGLSDEPPDDREEAQVSAEPTPPRVLETGVFYRDDHTGCDIIISEEGLDGDLNLALAGDRYEDIEARVYRPGSDTPLRHTDRLDDFFAESDEPFIWQYYSVTTPWDDGLYLLEVEVDGRTVLAYWNLERGGDQVLYAFCNTDENRLPVATLTPTLTLTPSPTPSPTVTPTPTLTRTPVPTRVRELRTGRELRDYITGCEVYIAPEGLDGHLHLVFTGDRREEVEALVYRPNGLRVEYTSQTHETFDDVDEQFVWQVYGDFTAWAAGLYRLVITLEDRTSELFWTPEREGDQVIYIDCDGALPRATITPRPTLTYTPSPTLTPSPTPTPTPEEVAADLRTGAVHKDEATGCTLLVLEFAPEQVDWKDLWVTFSGSERDAVEVDVWLPDATAPLPVDEFYEDVMETGESLLVQSYSPRTDWRNGLYRFDLSLAGDSSSLTWRMSGPGYYAVSFTCDKAPGPAPSV